MLESPATLRALDTMQKGTKAQAAWELLGEHLASEQRRLDIAMFTRLQKGEAITPDEAMQFIHSKCAVFRLTGQLEQKLRAGSSAGKQLQEVYKEIPDGR